jgi:hypothetical protein
LNAYKVTVTLHILKSEIESDFFTDKEAKAYRDYFTETNSTVYM